MTGGQVTDERRLVLWGEGSRRTGLGHLMRLLALGQSWLDGGGRVVALLGEAPDAIAARYEAEGFEVERASSTSDASDTLAGILRDDATARAAIDLPSIDPGDLVRLGAGAARTLVVDDMAALERYPVAIVLNQNAHADRAAYPRSDSTRYLLGLSYVMLRREFRRPQPPRSIPKRARRVLATFGGADPTGMARRTVAAVLALPPDSRRDLELRVVVGAASDQAEAIERIVAGSDARVTVERGVEDMASRMLWADLAVSSGGSTVWELARTGCPAIVVETAPAELYLVRGLDQMKLFDRLGPADTLHDDVLASTIASRAGDQAWRSEMAQRGAATVDGQGASRVVDALIALDAR
jgi:spore coat polysaccharide biosynthesis predicted glycosyltransferase SpsG